MARIVHPRPKPGRQKFLGILFRDGFAEADLNPHLEQALIQHGYTVEDGSRIPSMPGWYADRNGATFYRAEDGSWMSPEEFGADPIEIAKHLPLTPVAEPPFEPLPPADSTEKVSKPAKGRGRFAIIEQADGTVVGDSNSIVTLHADGTATTEA